MKSHFFHYTFLLLFGAMIALTACKNQAVGGTDDTETKVETQDTSSLCWVHQEAEVPEAMLILWKEHWATHVQENGALFGAWPTHFETDMDQFLTLFQPNENFRIYYLLTSLTDPEVALMTLPIDHHNCDPVWSDDSCALLFSPAGNQPPAIPGNCPSAYIPFDSALSWAANWRTTFDISTTNSIFTANDIAYQIPLAFNFKLESFYEHVDTSKAIMLIDLGLKPIDNPLNDSADYKFKLILGSKDGGPGGIPNPVRMDFAAPCPRNCGNIDSLLKGNVN